MNLKKIKSRLDFNFYKVNYVALIALVLSILFVKIFHITKIYENSLLENAQLFALLWALWLCLGVKKFKIFFNFTAIVLFLMFMREIAYGRAIFAENPAMGPGYLMPWKYYKYGWLSNVFVGIYMVLGGFYAIKNKVWVEFFEIIKNIKFPFWNLATSFICILLAIAGESVFNNTIIEETAELVLYCLIAGIIAIYAKKIEEI